MATHGNVPAWRIPGTEEPSGLPSVGSGCGGACCTELDITEVTQQHQQGLPWGSDCEKSACNARDLGIRSLGWEDPLEKGMATHPSTLAWKILRTEGPGALQYMG